MLLPLLFLSITFGFVLFILSLAIGSISTESQFENGPVATSNHVKWSNVIIWIVAAALGGIVFAYPVQLTPFFMTLIATVMGGWFIGSFVTQLFMPGEARKQMKLVSDLEQLGDNFLEQFDKDGDGVVGRNDVDFVRNQAPTGSELKKFANSLLSNMSKIGHDVGGARVMSRRDVIEYCVRTRTQVHLWMQTTAQ